MRTRSARKTARISSRTASSSSSPYAPRSSESIRIWAAGARSASPYTDAASRCRNSYGIGGVSGNGLGSLGRRSPLRVTRRRVQFHSGATTPGSRSTARSRPGRLDGWSARRPVQAVRAGRETWRSQVGRAYLGLQRHIGQRGNENAALADVFEDRRPPGLTTAGCIVKPDLHAGVSQVVHQRSDLGFIVAGVATST